MVDFTTHEGFADRVAKHFGASAVHALFGSGFRLR
jgi:hypothetical protein